MRLVFSSMLGQPTDPLGGMPSLRFVDRYLLLLNEHKSKPPLS